MNYKHLLLPLIAILPLSAQTWELGVFAGQQKYSNWTQTAPTVGASSFLKETATPDSKTVLGLRVGRSLLDLGPCLFEVTLGYQPEVSTPITYAIVSQTVPLTGPYTSSFTSTGGLKSSHYAVGAMFNFKAFVSVGLGVEYRFERLAYGVGASGSYDRPWARANIGVAIPSPIFKPFIGLEVAYPLASKGIDGDPANNGLKANAPKSEIGCYLGVRF